MAGKKRRMNKVRQAKFATYSSGKVLQNKIRKLRRYLKRVTYHMLKREHRNQQGKGKLWFRSVKPHIIRDDTMAREALKRLEMSWAAGNRN